MQTGFEFTEYNKNNSKVFIPADNILCVKQTYDLRDQLTDGAKVVLCDSSELSIKENYDDVVRMLQHGVDKDILLEQA